MNPFFVILLFALALITLLSAGIKLKEVRKLEKELFNITDNDDFERLILNEDVSDSDFWIIFLRTNHCYDYESFFDIIEAKRPEIYSKIMSWHNGDML